MKWRTGRSGILSTRLMVLMGKDLRSVNHRIVIFFKRNIQQISFPVLLFSTEIDRESNFIEQKEFFNH